MVNHEVPNINHHVPLGFGADYIIETGQIYFNNKLVGRLGVQASSVFEELIKRNGIIVDVYTLAQVGGNQPVESDWFAYDDVNRVQLIISRIRKTLKKASPGLAAKLQSSYNKGYRWGNSDEKEVDKSGF